MATRGWAPCSSIRSEVPNQKQKPVQHPLLLPSSQQRKWEASESQAAAPGDRVTKENVRLCKPRALFSTPEGH